MNQIVEIYPGKLRKAGNAICMESLIKYINEKVSN